MRRNAAIIALAVVLAGGGVYAGLKINGLTQQTAELRSSYLDLDTNYQALVTGYNDLQAGEWALENDYSDLQSSHAALQAQYDTLDSNYQALSQNYSILQGQASELSAEIQSLNSENARLQELVRQYEQVPQGYYTTGRFPYHANTLEDLYVFLDYEFRLPTSYQLGVFDCSESATYVEWALENSGFDADIVVGPPPWGGTGGHAWILVNFSNDTMIALEPAALTSGLFPTDYGLVGWEDPAIPEWRNYYQAYDAVCPNVYQAIKNTGTASEWNWWEGYWGFI